MSIVLLSIFIVINMMSAGVNLHEYIQKPNLGSVLVASFNFGAVIIMSMGLLKELMSPI